MWYPIVQIYHPLFTHLFSDFWVISYSGYCECHNEQEYSFFGTFALLGPLGCISKNSVYGSFGAAISSCFKIFILFTKKAGQVYIPNNSESVSFSPHLYQYRLFLFFLGYASLYGVRWYLIVILICIPLMINDVVNFICPLAICIYSLRNFCYLILPLFVFFLISSTSIL